ncbi:hypothetical protein BpHYR1_004285 [Brachionus plicatilis]|uniref:Uncharacterized protein n=1 Tax=Brachionus plicatilis TaxID=10195 RepID=A0A3M7PB70_BRAPC|nr:hypothetical protein BpHYR1_004285 [Brachionus plicatilis]
MVELIMEFTKKISIFRLRFNPYHFQFFHPVRLYDKLKQSTLRKLLNYKPWVWVKRALGVLGFL